MLKQIFESKKIVGILAILVTLIVLLVVFRFGMVVGERKADFSGRWGENYGRFFGEPRPGFFPAPAEFRDNRLMSPHGNAGTVLKINGDTIVLKGKDNIERTILISTSTVIMDMNENIGLDKINTGDSLVVIGEPTKDGQIGARFVRVFHDNK